MAYSNVNAILFSVLQKPTVWS